MSRQRWTAAACVVGACCMGVAPALAATIDGTPGDDMLIGTSRADVIRGYGGADVIRPLAGEDTVYGGSGSDTIRVTNGYSGEPDWVDAGSGNDLVRMAGNDVVILGDGDDVALSDTGGVIRGGAGDDDLQGGDVVGETRIYGGPGNDSATVFSDDIDTAVVLIRMGAGRDLVKPLVWWSYGPGGVHMYLGGGPDRAVLSTECNSRDVVYAGPGNDHIRVGNDRTKLVDCGPGADVLTVVPGAMPDTVTSCESVVVVDGSGA